MARRARKSSPRRTPFRQNQMMTAVRWVSQPRSQSSPHTRKGMSGIIAV